MTNTEEITPANRSKQRDEPLEFLEIPRPKRGNNHAYKVRFGFGTTSHWLKNRAEIFYANHKA